MTEAPRQADLIPPPPPFSKAYRASANPGIRATGFGCAQYLTAALVRLDTAGFPARGGCKNHPWPRNRGTPRGMVCRPMPKTSRAHLVSEAWTLPSNPPRCFWRVDLPLAPAAFRQLPLTQNYHPIFASVTSVLRIPLTLKPKIHSGPPSANLWSVCLTCLFFCLRAQFGRTNPETLSSNGWSSWGGNIRPPGPPILPQLSRKSSGE